jgi:hypothetical protein
MLVIDWEPFASMWVEGKFLARAHFHEVEGELVENRPFNVDEQKMKELNEAGVIRIVTARVNGKLAGYTTFTIMPDIESMSLTCGNQGAIYVAPGNEKLNLSSKMIDFAISGMKASGCDYVLLHHRLLGRGVKMGSLFKRKRAVLIRHEYYLWVGV